MPEKSIVDRTAKEKILNIIESLNDSYPEFDNKEKQELENKIEFLKRAITVIFAITFSHMEDENGFIDCYNTEGVIAKLMKKINPEIYSELFFLRERGII